MIHGKSAKARLDDIMAGLDKVQGLPLAKIDEQRLLGAIELELIELHTAELLPGAHDRFDPVLMVTPGCAEPSNTVRPGFYDAEKGDVVDVDEMIRRTAAGHP